ncbi:MAG: hypothetical protein SGPRY_003132 [Prymnesium sp.]
MLGERLRRDSSLGERARRENTPPSTSETRIKRLEDEELQAQLKQSTKDFRRRLSTRHLSNSSATLVAHALPPMPLPELLESIAAFSCIKAHSLADQQSRPRLSFFKCFRDFHLKRHGKRSVGESHARELLASASFYSTARVGEPVEKARMFQELTISFSAKFDAEHTHSPSLPSEEREERRVAFFLESLSCLLPPNQMEAKFGQLAARVAFHPTAVGVVGRVVIDRAMQASLTSRLEAEARARLIARPREDRICEEGEVVEEGAEEEGLRVEVDEVLRLLLDAWDESEDEKIRADEEVARRLFSQHDLNLDGVLDLDEFTHMISSISKVGRGGVAQRFGLGGGGLRRKIAIMIIRIA